MIMGELMTGLIKKIILTIVTGSAYIFLAACYGMGSRLDLYTPNFSTKKITAKAASNTPIKGLKVTLQRYGVDAGLSPSTTNESGLAVLSYIDDSTNDVTYSALINDVDGQDNGGKFISQTVKLNHAENYDATMINE
jgi:hypothetical protein